MMIMHRTIQRFVAAIMLLSFAAMFGAGYLPVAMQDHQGHVQTANMVMQASSSEIVLAKDAPHDCCDKDTTGFGTKELRCSVDCSFCLPFIASAFASSGKGFDEIVLYAIEPIVPTGFLRPPIA
ncbi:hypothetical protein [Cohaesibacter celericrescens]|jgi:hypothetical protein|uniref:Uncharacterized protein n=1 Tax=Cohaesibacter celericrescens TaxID=2067669 RepID=A0A2N5XJY2_9HYPH|nr:hypothetical protein [Cohaesibacter celericrescens]PLW74826.1 hypothetical protein C0081_21115 [Cohaesibacter celericrescens]